VFENDYVAKLAVILTQALPWHVTGTLLQSESPAAPGFLHKRYSSAKPVNYRLGDISTSPRNSSLTE
jgi:hypothetical protein